MLKPVPMNLSKNITIGSLVFLISDVIVIKGDGNYSNIFIKGGKRFLTCRTLKYYDSLLIGQNFIRPSKSALINFDFIKRADFKSQRSFFLTNNDIISISRRNLKPLREKFQSVFNS